MIYAVLIIAAVALGLAAFALYVALAARGRAIDAQQRTARHQLEHRTGAEDTGIRRHRAVEEPPTSQIAAQRPARVRPGPGQVEPDVSVRPPLPPDPATSQIGEPPTSGPYARLRENADRRVDTDDLPATAAHERPRRPGNAPNFAEAPPRPAGPALPPPGRIDRDR
jgi:hypothetical protein